MKTEFNEVAKTALTEIKYLFDSVDQEQIQMMVNLILDKRFDKIVGFGAGRMGYSLRAFIMRLSHIGLNTYMIGDTSFPRLDSKTLVIVNSSSGETPTSVLYAKQAQSAESIIITVTANKKSSLCEISDLAIDYNYSSSTQIMKTLPEQFTFILFDVISEIIIKQMNGDRDKISYNHSISE